MTHPLAGEYAGLLSRISDGMVKAQRDFWGKGPEEVKSYFLDDMLLIVMKGGLTVAEKSMLDFGEHDQVRAFRQTFENRMTEHLTGMIENLTDRRVLTYQSQILFDPHRVIELFVFDGPAPADPESPNGGVATGRARG